jgi:hypothetical protein
MNYAKPEIISYGSPIAIVQSGSKSVRLYLETLDPTGPRMCNGAYEADE